MTKYRYVNGNGEEAFLEVPYEAYDPDAGGMIPPPSLAMTLDGVPTYFTWISAEADDPAPLETDEVPDDLVTEPELPPEEEGT